MSYNEEPEVILAREVKQLRNKQVLLVKVLWQHHGREEATWELEETMKVQYPQFFTTGKNFEDEICLRGGGGGGGDSCHGRVSGINKICFLYSSYCRSQATAV